MFKDILDKLLEAAGYIKVADMNADLPRPDIGNVAGGRTPLLPDPKPQQAVSKATGDKDPMDRNRVINTLSKKLPGGPVEDINDPNTTPTPVGTQVGIGL